MKKRRKGRKFSLKTDQRGMLLRSLAGSLFLKEKIKVTEAKAKETSRFSAKILTHAVDYANATDPIKKLNKERLLLNFFSTKVVKKLKEELGPRYKERKGGYTRITKLMPRKSDASRMALIELMK